MISSITLSGEISSRTNAFFYNFKCIEKKFSNGKLAKVEAIVPPNTMIIEGRSK